jgi:hypothetical protein
MKRLLALLLLCLPSMAMAQRDSTVCVSFRIRTATTGAIQTTSVAKVVCGGAPRVDTVRITLPAPPPVHDTITLPGYTQYFYWHPVVFGSLVTYQLASRNNDPTPPPSTALPASRTDTVRLRDTLAYFPSITPAFDSVRFTLQPYHASPIWTPAPIALKIDRFFYWWPVVGTDSIRFELREGGTGASHPPSIPVPQVPGSRQVELPRVYIDTKMPPTTGTVIPVPAP